MILLNQSIDNLTDIYNLTLLLKTFARNNTPLFDDDYVLYPIEWVIPITVLYAIIFITGIIGNVSTCIVISRSKSLHTVTNYYLFSIAMSDLLLLISGLPPEMYRIWSPENYVFGEAFCVAQGFAAETSANATVLAITAFTVERYLAICHPFRSHTMSNLSRAIKYIIAIWIVALCLAAPQAIQFGVSYETKHGVEYSKCTVVSTDLFQHAFEISTFLIFVGPMTLITVLYVLIGIKLRKSRRLYSVKRSRNDGVSRASRIAASQKRVIKMLIHFEIHCLFLRGILTAIFVLRTFHQRIVLYEGSSQRPLDVVQFLQLEPIHHVTANGTFLLLLRRAKSIRRHSLRSYGNPSNGRKQGWFLWHDLPLRQMHHTSWITQWNTGNFFGHCDVT